MRGNSTSIYAYSVPRNRIPSLTKTESESMSPPRDWSELPDLFLLSVICRLPYLPDFFAFAGVCRNWRHLLRSSATLHYLSARPPLLLRPQTLSQPPRLQTLESDRPGSTLRSLVPSSLRCLGYSYGLLLLLRHLGGPHPQLILSDAFTGSEIGPPPLPPNRYSYYYAALTAPPSSPDSVLLVFYCQHHFLYHRLAAAGGGGWSTCRLNTAANVTRVLPFKNRRVLAVNHQANKILEFEFGRESSVKVFNVEKTVFDRLFFGPQLVECGGELLLLLFVKPKENRSIAKIDLYRLDFERMVWMGVEELGDYALFVDSAGRCPVLCCEPEQWGGRSNCVYLTGTGCDSWREFPLDGKNIDGHSFLKSGDLLAQRWPSPIWVYPSLFFV